VDVEVLVVVEVDVDVLVLVDVDVLVEAQLTSRRPPLWQSVTSTPSR
jgi:hypothetical protein